GTLRRGLEDPSKGSPKVLDKSAVEPVKVTSRRWTAPVSARSNMAASRSFSLRDRPRDLELPVVPDQGVVSLLMAGPPHLHAPEAELDVRLPLVEQPQDDDAVGEEVLVVP